EVDAVAGGALAPGGDAQRMMDQQHVEARAVDLVHRQRRAVEADRTLRRDEFRQFGRGFKREADGVALILARDDLRHAVDMAGHDGAAEFVAYLQRAFEIDAGALAPAGRGGEAQRLLPRLDLEPARVGAPVRQRDHGQAYAGAGDGSADVDGRG